MKEAGEIGKILKNDKPQAFLSVFEVLQADSDVIPIYLKMMEVYNLLPNDALILAYCKLNNIEVLASYDTTDFKDACLSESIILVQESQDLVAIA